MKLNIFNRYGISYIKNERMNGCITDIILRRRYDVPKSFLIRYMNDQIMECLLDSESDINLNRYSSAVFVQNTFRTNVENYERMIYYIRNDTNVSLEKQSLLQRMTSVTAVLTLKRDREWESFIRMKKKEMRRMEVNASKNLYDCLNALCFNFVEFEYSIHSVIIRTLFNEFSGTLEEDMRNQNISLRVLDNIIHVMDHDMSLCELPLKYTWFLQYYWKSGGTYFPENLSVISSVSSDMDNWESMIRLYEIAVKNKKAPHAKGYIKVKYWREGMSPKGIFKFILENDAGYDANSFENLFTLPLSTKDINVIRELVNTIPYHKRMLNVLLGSVIPLKDFRLYAKLFGYPAATPDTYIRFISRGGDPTTLMLAGVEQAYNVCYTPNGIRTVLLYSKKEYIKDMLKDDVFVSSMKEVLCSRNVDGLFTRDLSVKLLEAVADLEKSSDDLCTVVRKIIYLIGFDYMMQNVPTCLQYVNRFLPDKYTGNQFIANPYAKVIPYIPIEYMLRRTILQYMENVRSTDEFHKLNTMNVKLDDVLTKDDMRNIFLNDGGKTRLVEYIPDLTTQGMEMYLNQLTDRPYCLRYSTP